MAVPAEWTRYATWTAYALLALGVALRLWQVSAAATDYDEGVYWQSLRALTHGQPLFTSVFSSQPPVFLYSIYPFYLVLGQSLAAARLGVVVYSLVGIGAVYVIGKLAAGHWAGLIAAVQLALDPIYLQESRTLQAEVPALGLALVGVALAMLAWRAAGGRRRWLALASGVALALGIGVKLFDVVALVPAVMYLAAPVAATFTDGSGALTRPERRELRAAVLRVLPDLGLLLVGFLLGTVLYIVPFVGAWPSFYDQVVRFHMRAGQVFATGLMANVITLANVGSELPIACAALAAAAVAVWRRMWVALPLILWAAASAALLLQQHPLFTHHVALLAPPLASVVAVVAVEVWRQTTALRAVPRAGSTPLPARARALTLGAVLVLALFGLAAGVAQAVGAHGPTAQQLAIADTLAATTQAGDEVLSDDQYLAALADRDVPPLLVDTSTVRIQSGYLTAEQLEQAAQAANVRAVLFANGRFNEVPGFQAWVQAHFTQMATFGHGVTLYVKVPRTPVPA